MPLRRHIGANGVPAAIVRDTATAVRDPRALGRAETVSLSHPVLGPVDELYGSGFPVRFSEADAGYESPPPWLGEHNDFVLGGMQQATSPSGSKPSGPQAISNPQNRTSQSKAVRGKPGRGGERQEPEESAVAEESGPPGEYQAT